MCGKEPNTTAEVNSAKCWAIPALVFSIIALIGFIAGGWVQAIGGLLACIGSSILICGGPKDGSAAGGKRKEKAAEQRAAKQARAALEPTAPASTPPAHAAKPARAHTAGCRRV